MNNQEIQNHLEEVTKDLVASGNFPKHVDVTSVAGRYWVACYDAKSDHIMNETSTTGFANNPQTALFKALSEKVERSAFRNGNKNKLSSCLTSRSDGFAAYPICFDKAEHKVRESALSEAIERYVWATWWDHSDIAFDINLLEKLSSSSEVLNYSKEIAKECRIGEVFVIQPQVENLGNKYVTIIFGHLKDGGFISGGACGERIDQVLLRSLDELFRHGLALNKIKSQNLKSKSFYEERLMYFGYGEGNHLISQRLASNGDKVIKLPKLCIDETIPSDYEKHFLVHRCLFENQPDFIGGRLERMCL